MFKFDNTLNQIGLYYIPYKDQYYSYFLKRAWGNYLFFPHPEIEKLYPFIIDNGGIYKVFDFSLPFKFYNKELFVKFGASTIVKEQTFESSFRCETFGIDYFDMDIKLTNQQILILKKNTKINLFDSNESSFEKNIGEHYFFRSY